MAKSLKLILCYMLSLHYQMVLSQCVRQPPNCNRQELIDQRVLQPACPRQQAIVINRPEIPCPCQQPVIINRPDIPCPCQQCQQPIVINRPEACPYQQSVVINRPEIACPCPQCQSAIIEPACNRVPVIPQAPSTIIITDCTPESCKNLADTLQLMVVCNMLENTQGSKQYALQLAEPILNELLTSPVFSCGCPNPIANNFVAPYPVATNFVAPNLIANGIAPVLTSVGDFCPNPNIITNLGQCQCRKGLTDVLNFV